MGCKRRRYTSRVYSYASTLFVLGSKGPRQPYSRGGALPFPHPWQICSLMGTNHIA